MFQTYLIRCFFIFSQDLWISVLGTLNLDHQEQTPEGLDFLGPFLGVKKIPCFFFVARENDLRTRFILEDHPSFCKSYSRIYLVRSGYDSG